MKTLTTSNLAIQKIRNDHQKVLDLFALFEAETDNQLRREIGAKALRALKAHAFLEESLLYPITRASIENEEIVDRAEAAHSFIDKTVMELDDMPAGARFNSNFHVLAAAVRSHIDDEEENLLPALEESGVDLQELGKRMLRAGRRTGGVGAGLLLLGAAAVAGLYLSRRPAYKRTA